MQLGGDDQWSNIIGGIELCRRKDQKSVYGMTFTLLTNSEGKKMGKTASGAVWLDPEKYSPYDFYQYWRNVDDRDACKFLKMLTFVPMEEIREYEKLTGSDINKVKARLAYEVTKLVHGEEEAGRAKSAAEAVFGGVGSDENMPSFEVEVTGEQTVIEVLVNAGFIPSKGEGRRLVQQGGLSLDGEKLTDFAKLLTTDMFTDGKLVVKKGKKSFLKLISK